MLYMSAPSTRHALRDKFFDSFIGRAFREWNSRNGVSFAAWTLLVTSAVMCSSCLRMFSFDGHKSHLDDGGCSYSSGQLATTAEAVQGL